MTDLVPIILFSLKVLTIILAILIVYFSFKSTKNFSRNRRTLILLEDINTKEELPILYWENTVGRNKHCDIKINDPAISREHAVIFRRKEGWFITDTNSKYGVFLNGEKINGKTKIFINDIITLGETSLVLKTADQSKEISSNKEKLFKNVKPLRPGKILFFITLLNLLFIGETFIIKPNSVINVAFPIIIFLATCWIFFFISKYLFSRATFEIENLAILLISIGLNVIVNYKVELIFSQLISIALGMICFLFIIWFIKNPDNVKKFRLLIAIIAVIFFVINLLFAKEINGSRNWISFGGLSLQPSEFIKIAFIFVGASTLEDLQTTKNLTGFILFSAICIGALFLMKDFGTACVFFVGFLVIAFMRSGSIRTLIFSCATAILGSFLVLTFKPYIKDRFAVWGHAFEYPNAAGYQQARVLSYCASGGLFGVGLGNGYLQYIFASMSDLMFGVICEELGFIMAMLVALTITGFAFFARGQSIKSRSTFYSISSCAAAAMLIFQAALHIFGSTDILPLTGVTLPFVSLGGSSMISSFGLLAFIKASDERTYAIRRN